MSGVAPPPPKAIGVAATPGAVIRGIAPPPPKAIGAAAMATGKAPPAAGTAGPTPNIRAVALTPGAPAIPGAVIRGIAPPPPKAIGVAGTATAAGKAPPVAGIAGKTDIIGGDRLIPGAIAVGGATIAAGKAPPAAGTAGNIGGDAATPGANGEGIIMAIL
jgi:hypothetical protein